MSSPPEVWLNLKRLSSLSFVLACSLMAGGVPLFAQADEISTDVDSQATVSHLWRSSHPAKLFKCWGKPEEADTWTDKREGRSRGDNQGRLKTEARGDGKSGFQDYRPQSLSWKAELSKERDLSLEFHQEVTESQTSYIHHQCSTQRFVSRLDAVRNRLSSQARFQVPEGVWLLRIRKNLESQEGRTHQDLRASVSGVDEVISDLATMKDGAGGRAVRLSVGDSEYLLVEPGSQVDFRVSWSSEEARNLAFQVKYQIRMIGVDECRHHFGSPVDFGRRSELESLAEDLRDDRVSKDPHTFIEKMSCLRNGDYLQSLMYSNHGRTLSARFMDLNQAFTEWLLRRAAPKDFDVIELTTRMSLLEGARWLLTDFLIYCDVREVRSLFGLPAASTAKARGYQVMARTMAQVKYLLDVVPIELTESYVRLVETLSKSNQTYASSLTSRSSLSVLRELHDTLMDDEFMVFQPIKHLLDDLKDLRSGRKDRNQAREAAVRAISASEKFQSELRVSFQRFGSRDPSKVDPRGLRRAWAELQNAHSAILQGLNEDLEWFLGNESQASLDYPPFTRDLMSVNQDLLRSVSDTLAATHAGKLEGRFEAFFLRSEETKQLYQSARQCLRSSDGN